jgi:iron complex outermembrane receptor protein
MNRFKLSKFAATGLLSACLVTTAFAAEMEEVVVTGSYIKRSAEDSPVPLTVYTKADLDIIGATDIKDVVSNMTFNSGSLGGASNAFSGGDNSTGNASVNLRNLGNGATLVLLNGKRTVQTNFDNVGSGYVDIQGLIPNIALERVEVVKDGASALYGADAVAGVVNFITRDSFEGMEIQYDYGVDDESGEQSDSLIAIIMGAASDAGHVTVSASYLDRGGLQIGDRYEDFGRSGLSSFGQPGRYVALGGITAAPSFFSPAGSSTFGGGADPDCDLASANDGPMGAQGLSLTGNGQCIYDFSSFFNLVMEETQAKMHVDASVNLKDNLEAYGSLSFSDNFAQRGNSLYPDVNFATIGTDHFGLQLDSARRGIAPVPYLALQRMMGGHFESSAEDRPLNTDSTYARTNYRFNTGLIWDFEMGGNDWTMDASATYSKRNSLAINPSDSLTDNTNLAYVGLGGPSCNSIDTANAGSGNLGTGDCYYYNSFQTSVYDPVTSQRWNTTDTSAWAADPTLTVAEAALRYQNPTELLEWMQGEITTSTISEQMVLDVVFAGNVFEMGGGAAGLAVGAQYRADQISQDIDTNSNNNNFKFIYGAADWQNELDSTSLFAELYLPINDWIELTLAGRYEDFDQLDTNTFDPKATLMMRPTETVTIRASIGTSFRVGSLLQSGGSATSLLNSTDSFSGTGGLAFRPTITTGNPNLKPESADVWNIGVSWIPDGDLEGLNANLDYYNYTYNDLISREGHQDLINRDNALRCPNGFNDDPTMGALCGVSDQDGNGLTEVYSIGAGIPDKVIRSADGGLLRTAAGYFNAPSLETSGFDLGLGYNFGIGDMGEITTNLAMSYTLSYDIVSDSGVNIDGVGSRNQGNSIGFPLPEYRANFTLGWSKDIHGASLIVRHIAGYTDDVPQSALRGAYIGFAPEIDSFTTIDVQYNLALPALSFQNEGSVVTFGIKNLANEVPPLVNTDGAFDPFTHDPRGRIYYGRFTFSL